MFRIMDFTSFPGSNNCNSKRKSIENKIHSAFAKNGLGDYKKNQKVFDTLLPFQDEAIKNSNNILPVYKLINWEIQLSEQGNPSTSIHFLVKEINMIIRDGKNDIL